MSAQEIHRSGVATWRDMMPTLRVLSFQLRDEGRIEILQKGQVLDTSSTIDNVVGPIRIRKLRT